MKCILFEHASIGPMTLMKLWTAYGGSIWCLALHPYAEDVGTPTGSARLHIGAYSLYKRRVAMLIIAE